MNEKYLKLPTFSNLNSNDFSSADGSSQAEYEDW
jgi:hypothetical protein